MTSPFCTHQRSDNVINHANTLFIWPRPRTGEMPKKSPLRKEIFQNYLCYARNGDFYEHNR